MAWTDIDQLRAFKWRGTWASGTSYSIGDVVFRTGSSYVATLTTTNNDPLTDGSAHWSLVCQQGTTGTTGTAGTPGTPGQGFTFRGAWNSGTTYSPYDVVTIAGSSYVSILGGVNQTPASSPTYWTQIAAAGATGTTGTPGTPGAAGARGSKFLGSYANTAALPTIDGTTVMVNDFAYTLDTGSFYVAQ